MLESTAALRQHLQSCTTGVGWEEGWGQETPLLSPVPAHTALPGLGVQQLQVKPGAAAEQRCAQHDELSVGLGSNSFCRCRGKKPLCPGCSARTAVFITCVQVGWKHSPNRALGRLLACTAHTTSRGRDAVILEPCAMLTSLPTPKPVCKNPLQGQLC